MTLDSFTDDLYADFSSKSPHENVFFSPFSISVALSMILCGSEGDTEDQIKKALGLDADNCENSGVLEKLQKLTSKNPAVVVNTFNNLYLESFNEIKSDYANVLKNCGCKVQNLSFKTKEDREESAEKINKLVAENTRNRIIKAIAPDSLTELIRMVLTSVVYFKGRQHLGNSLRIWPHFTTLTVPKHQLQ